MPTTKTGYSVTFGGGRGYINIGGWNSAITDRSTAAQEVVGVWRQEGANLYVYGAQGTHTTTGNTFLIIGTALTVGTDGLMSPIVFTAVPDAGTENLRLIRAMTIATSTGGTYGWYFVRGICTVQLQTDTTTLANMNLICASTDSHAKVKLATTTAQGYVLTAIACDVSGPAYLSLLSAWR